MTTPIPKRPSGFLLGDKAAELTIDVFVDIQCPHSRTIWSTLLDVMKHYEGKSLSLKVHLITLRAPDELALAVGANCTPCPI